MSSFNLFGIDSNKGTDKGAQYQSIPSFDIDASSAGAKVETKSNRWKWIAISMFSALMVFLLSYKWFSIANTPTGTSLFGTGALSLNAHCESCMI